MVRTPEVERIVGVARALADIPEPILFVGGSVVGLLATSPRAARPRATDDVDLVAFVSDYAGLAVLHERLRQRGFSEDVESRVICRWRFQGWIVDVMPPDADILGFANLLYPSAVRHPLVTTVDGVPIRHIDAPHFIGTKLLAYEDRGRGEVAVSHDLEDVFAVVSSRPEVVDEIASAPAECREVVLPRLSALRDHSEYEYSVGGHLANDTPDQTDVVLARIDAILKAAG